jgi:hypothetical protein
VTRLAPVPGGVVVTLLVAKHTYLGYGYLQRRTPVMPGGLFQLVAHLAPLQVWGLLILAGAPLTLSAPWLRPRWAATVNIAAAAPMTVFAVLLLFTELAGLTPSFGTAVLFVLPVVLHASLARSYWLNGAHTPPTQRRSGQ